MTDIEQRAAPGVYVEEPSAFPTAVVGVQTAVPLFVGYTEFAGLNGRSAYGRPVAITSPADYSAVFGGAAPGGGFNLSTQIQLFYDNGGSNALVVSAGSYWAGQAPIAAPADTGDWKPATIDAGALTAALAAADNQAGPTMIVIPEACLLDQAGYSAVACAMLKQAGRLKDRVAILDLPGCLTATDVRALEACQANMWVATSPQDFYISYGASYGPALVLPDGSVTPPSGALAGIWSANDEEQGVWHAPADVSLAGVDRPLVDLNDDQQGGFNVPVNGKAVNILRAFADRGTVVWGARTLDGNSDDYRYIQVRRTLVYIETSAAAALEQFVFAPNTAPTWASVTAMIASFLDGLWQQGALAGSKPGDAFDVRCGLGSTMTADDVLSGILRVNVVLALTHPAEFTTLTFQQQLLTS